MSTIESDMWRVIRSNEQATERLNAMAISPAINGLLDRLDEAQSSLEGLEDTTPAPPTTSPAFPWAIALGAAGLGVGLGAAAVAIAATLF